jgi:tetratricopeptide (TPR) repeat protein
MNKAILIVVFALNVFKLLAQDVINSSEVEQKSYQLYLDKNWQGLIKYGNLVLKSGYDYFYLQMRIGIAYYENKNYCLAENHFKRALQFSSNDQLAKEYLYYCYVFTGRTEEARKLSKQFNKQLAKKTGTDKLSPVDFVIMEGGTKIAYSAGYYDKNTKTNSNYFNPALYIHAGIGSSIKNRVSLFNAVTYFNQTTFTGTVSQFQYYLKSVIPIKNNWLISPAFHWINIDHTAIIPVSVVTTTQRPGRPPNPNMPTQTIQTNSNYFVGAFYIQKNINKFVLILGSTVSNMNGQTLLLHNGIISYSVPGNSRIVLGCTGYIHTINSYSTINNSVSPFVYVQPFKKMSVKISYLQNKGSNIIEDDGYLVNNSGDLTTSRWSYLMNVNVSQHVTLYGLYQLENKQESMQLYNYRYNVIVAGIKIIP